MVERFPDGAVQVLTVRQDSPDVRARLARYRDLLGTDEREREARFSFEADRERFVIGRALVRLQLSRYLGGDPRHWAFTTNAHGRPELTRTGAAPALGFNVSHTRGLVACVFARTHDVGVDVERVDRVLTHEVADRFFAPAEVAALRALPRAEQPRVFFDYWTLKEAYIKARGMGLALPLRHFAFRLQPPAPPTIAFDPEIDDDARTWQFAQAWPTGHHRLAVAVRRTGADLHVRIEDVVPQVGA